MTKKKGKDSVKPGREAADAQEGAGSSRDNSDQVRPWSSDLTDHDVYLFREGTHFRMYEKLGAHLAERDGEPGVRFSVWAPNARSVSVIGTFNGWDRLSHPMHRLGDTGIWESFVPGVAAGAVYKYHIVSHHRGHSIDKADPYGFSHEEPPRTGSVVSDLDYAWGDHDWMTTRGASQALGRPTSIYEVHLGSWRRVHEQGDRFLSYREIAEPLARHVKETGFTHVELLPVMEHPFYGSWGYQTTGYFAPTRRYGEPVDLMYLIDHLHQNGIGVILDWVPSHFPTDGHGLSFFDGTWLYEHADPKRGYHPDWKSSIFNYGRHEVRSFLLSSAAFWLDQFHADGIRVDAVASMLYLDYSRKEGGWVPNRYGGREDLEALEFLRVLNEGLYRDHPDIQMIAEESTAWPMVSKPVWLGGLGFGMKWDLGWMHDTLEYMRLDSIHRAHHHTKLTFRMLYAWSENYVLPLSHDEVVHGKGSLINKMSGDRWRKFANLRLLYTYMWTQPGKKLLFMGNEFAQAREWNHDRSLDWSLLEEHHHAAVLGLVARLNDLYRTLPALHKRDVDHLGFEWIDANDAMQSVISYVRRGDEGDPPLLMVLNFTPVPRKGYRVGSPLPGAWKEILNTDAIEWGGSGVTNDGTLETDPIEAHGRRNSLRLTLPPLGAVVLSPETPPPTPAVRNRKREDPTR